MSKELIFVFKITDIIIITATNGYKAHQLMDLCA